MTDLDFLKPKKKELVFDLVEAAGLDVNDWIESAKNSEKIKDNPKYCYNWSFVDSGNLIVLCLWHELTKSRNGQIFQTFAFNDWMSQFRPLGRSNPKLRRAEAFAEAVERAYKQRLPLRVILLTGKQSDPNKVALRYLDPEPWRVIEVEKLSRTYTLIRSPEGTPHPLYVDQFSLSEGPFSSSPQQVESVTRAFKRSGAVRNSALDRAAGHCEFCNEPGFRMPDGRLYLETHHIVPLSQGGLDQPRNVVALCGNHHREAHFGERREEIAGKLLGLISTFYGRRTPL